MLEKTIGTCGNCGGPVTVPIVFWSVRRPRPTCAACGATPKQAYGPVIEMETDRPQTVRDAKHGTFVGARWPKG